MAICSRTAASAMELSSLNRSITRSFGATNGARVVAAIGKFNFGKTVGKTVKKASGALKKFSPANKDRPLWFPGAKAPEWLDGSLLGDYGFDPLSLSKPPEYLQFDLDSLDQNLAKNPAGSLLGSRKVETKNKEEISNNTFQPYTEVFSLNRFRENEVIHGRWAMLGVLGALSVEALTGVTWQDAGKVGKSPEKREVHPLLRFLTTYGKP